MYINVVQTRPEMRSNLCMCVTVFITPLDWITHQCVEGDHLVENIVVLVIMLYCYFWNDKSAWRLMTPSRPVRPRVAEPGRMRLFEGDNQLLCGCHRRSGASHTLRRIHWTCCLGGKKSRAALRRGLPKRKKLIWFSPTFWWEVEVAAMRCINVHVINLRFE